MHWIVWLILFQEIATYVVGEIREISLKHYIKSKGYKIRKKPKKVIISDFIITRIRMAVPIYGTLMLLIMLFVSDETAYKTAREKDMLERLQKESGDK